MGSEEARQVCEDLKECEEDLQKTYLEESGEDLEE